MSNRNPAIFGPTKTAPRHVYQSSGSSREPYCIICGLDNSDNETCFENPLVMRLLIRKRLRRAFGNPGTSPRALELADDFIRTAEREGCKIVARQMAIEALAVSFEKYAQETK